MSADESAMLQQLADKDGFTQSTVFRKLVREAFKAAGLQLPKKTPKKRS
jgi:hypothetical protein